MSSEWLSVAEIFGEDVFNDAVMQERLPKKVYKKLKQTIEEGKELDLETAGNTVILISSELSEIMSLSDRVIVMYKGKISGEVSPKEVSMAAMGLLMAGIGKEEQDHEKER